MVGLKDLSLKFSCDKQLNIVKKIREDKIVLSKKERKESFEFCLYCVEYLSPYLTLTLKFWAKEEHFLVEFVTF